MLKGTLSRAGAATRPRAFHASFESEQDADEAAIHIAVAVVSAEAVVAADRGRSYAGDFADRCIGAGAVHIEAGVTGRVGIGHAGAFAVPVTVDVGTTRRDAGTIALLIARLMNPNALLTGVGGVLAEIVRRAVRIEFTWDAPIDANAVFAVEALEAVRLFAAPGGSSNASLALTRQGDAVAPAGTIGAREACAAHRVRTLRDRSALLGRTSGLDADTARHAVDVCVAKPFYRALLTERARRADVHGGAAGPAEARNAPAARVAACASGASSRSSAATASAHAVV